MTAGESFAARASVAAADLDKLVRRLRSLSPRAWQDRSATVRAALAGLVELSSELEGRALEPPEVADHVLPDAVAVIGTDVLTTARRADDEAAVARMHELIKTALNVTR